MEALAIIGTGILMLIVAKMLRKKPLPQVHDAGRSSQQRSGANPDSNWEDHVNHHHPGIGLGLAVGIGAGVLISRSRDAGEEAELGSLVEAEEFEHERGYYEYEDPKWEESRDHRPIEPRVAIRYCAPATGESNENSYQANSQP